MRLLIHQVEVFVQIQTRVFQVEVDGFDGGGKVEEALGVFHI